MKIYYTKINEYTGEKEIYNVRDVENVPELCDEIYR